jgi:hypothetical protein
MEENTEPCSPVGKSQGRKAALPAFWISTLAILDSLAVRKVSEAGNLAFIKTAKSQDRDLMLDGIPVSPFR